MKKRDAAVRRRPGEGGKSAGRPGSEEIRGCLARRIGGKPAWLPRKEYGGSVRELEVDRGGAGHVVG
ncbi:MAG: hypothetical protein J6Z13_05050, partial [Clostridia bacterium]|nr:hypothetical protein [Clostridia bacterium]